MLQWSIVQLNVYLSEGLTPATVTGLLPTTDRGEHLTLIYKSTLRPKLYLSVEPSCSADFIPTKFNIRFSHYNTRRVFCAIFATQHFFLSRNSCRRAVSPGLCRVRWLPDGFEGSRYQWNLLLSTGGRNEGFQSSLFGLAFHDCPDGDAGSRYQWNDLLAT